MINKDNIAKVVELFKTRQVKLYHACQLQDFESYLKLGGIPSRRKLEGANNKFTPFVTDTVDRINGVWDKVFVNLSDFGRGFSIGAGATPNTYGPLLLVINPLALSDAIDISITLRSAGANDFNREKESLSTINEIDQLFLDPVTPGQARTYIKFKEALQKDFNFPKATNPEINCTYPNEVIPLSYVENIVVDPYIFPVDQGEPLQNIVFYMMKNHNLRCGMNKRYCKSYARSKLYNEIITYLPGDPSFKEILASDVFSAEMKLWIQQMQAFNLEYQFRRFANYLFEGTLSPALSILNC